MTPDNEGAAAVAEAHPSDSVPVDVGEAAPLVVAKEPPAADGGDPAVPVADATAADAPGADGQPKPGKPPKLPEYAQKILNDLAAEKRIADRENKRLADELAALKAPKPEPAPAAAVPTAADAAAVTAAAPQGGFRSDADFNAAVQAEATKRTAQAAFNKRSNDAFTAGNTTFGEESFKDAIANLHQVGVLPYADQSGNVFNNEILEMVLATDDPSKVLYELGSNPDKASSIVSMTPAARAIEIAKLAVSPQAKGAPPPLSKAPRPIPPVDGSARVNAAPSDADDDDTFFAKREAELEASGRW